LERDPENRLGSGPEDANEIKSHPFFSTMNWTDLLQKKVTPPFKPHVESETDTSNFDPVFTKAAPVDDSVPKHVGPLSETLQMKFKGFTFTGESLEDYVNKDS
jgi:hypothetical protein